MSSIQELADLIAELPSIGPRQARRIVQFLLRKSPSFRKDIAEKIASLSGNVFQCRSCFRYEEGTGNELCILCKDANRGKTLMVVEKDVDIEGVEASNAYRGRYFVLGGLMPLAKQRKNTVVRSKELLSRIEKNDTTEIILALAITPEGDFTAHELAKEIKTKAPQLLVTLLGRGLSVGAEIEYADQETIRNALKNRA